MIEEINKYKVITLTDYMNLCEKYGKNNIDNYFEKEIKMKDINTLSSKFPFLKSYLYSANNNEENSNIVNYNESIKNETGKRLLSHEEEIELFKKIELAKNIDLDYILKCELTDKQKNKLLFNEVFNKKELNKYDKKINDDNIEEYINLLCESSKAKNKLFIYNQKLIISIAIRYNTKNLDLLDLIQEGNIGLMKAIDKFDISKNNKFSTCATWWIKQSIIRAIENKDRTIKIPVYTIAKINKMERIQKELTLELCREPNEKELADKMNLSVKKIKELCKCSKRPVSLQTPVGEDNNSCLGDIIEDKNNVNPEDYTIEKIFFDQKIKLLYEKLDSLDPDEKDFISLRYGLRDGNILTLQQMGDIYNCTHQNIDQKQREIIKKLRRKCNAYR